jgi:hypothetical protein
MKSADSFLSYILVCYVGAKFSTIDMFDTSDTFSAPAMFGMSEAGVAFVTEARANARSSTTSERIKSNVSILGNSDQSQGQWAGKLLSLQHVCAIIS